MTRRSTLAMLAAWLSLFSLTLCAAAPALAQATAAPSPAAPPALRVLCAGAVKSALVALAPAWAARGGTPWQATYAPAGELRRLLAAGTPADLLILPAEQLDELDRAGSTSAASRRALGGVGIGVAVKAGVPLPDVSTEAALRTLLLQTPSLTYMDPERGTSGKHVHTVVLPQLGIVSAVQSKTVLGQGGLIAEKVASGEVALALQQMTELVAVPGVVVAGPLPPALQKTTVYAGAPLLASPARAQAEALLAWLSGADARPVFSAQGFAAPVATGIPAAAAMAAPGAATNTASATAGPPPVSGDWVVRDFRFHTGQVLPELRLHYTTVGAPGGEPVLVLHGTTGSGAGMLNPAFGGELFGPGQPLDARRYYVILPDAIGTGQSSKPSDGLRAAFPAYNYDDMVRAQYRLLTEHLGVKHLRLVIGNSMGGMQTWLWAQNWPGFMDVAVPMASLPVAMSGRNWLLRRLVTDSIRRDPAWQGGNYTVQPPSWQFASVFYNLASNGGNQALMAAAPTRSQADALLDKRLTGPFAGDANDHLLQWESSGDYDPSAGLEKIEARLLAINSADDERNPPELGLLERELRRVRHGSALIVPASAQTAGHGTTAQARWWKAALVDLLASAPRR
jgi:homoserine O-acetyltransferase